LRLWMVSLLVAWHWKVRNIVDMHVGRVAFNGSCQYFIDYLVIVKSIDDRS
jgi:hypothetical protein